MSQLEVIKRGERFLCSGIKPRIATGELRKQFSVAEPFPHLVLDDFLPTEFIRAIVDNFPAKSEASVYHTVPHQQGKRGYRPQNLGDNPCRHYLPLFNSPPVVKFLETVTGIKPLLIDPSFLGGGLHEIDPGGKLAVHSDFNLHKELNLQRRINMLIYLNESWEANYAGNLELWDGELSQCVKSIAPIFNRCVIFATDLKSFHGHPETLSCPEHMTRRSIALYYYTAIEPGDKLNTTSVWRPRPGSHDLVPSGRKSVARRVFNKLKRWN